MTSLYTQGGKLLLRGGLLAAGQPCCCGGSECCCVQVTETLCCPSSSTGSYITDEERDALEAECSALGGTLRITSRRRVCLQATAEQCATGGPCSDTCPPPTAPTRDCPSLGSTFVSDLMTYEEALAAVNALSEQNGQPDEFCPSPFFVRVVGPLLSGTDDCTSGGAVYYYRKDCLYCPVYYTCSGQNGCEASDNPPAGFTPYATLEECAQACNYLGVICDDWDYYEQKYYECRGPQYGMPGSEMGPATCEDCNPECCPVVITGTCFGSGANASIVADENSSPPGRIVEVILTRPGSGYAKNGRGQPALSISGAPGTSFQLAGPIRTGPARTRPPSEQCLPPLPPEPPGPCDLPYWTIVSISIPSDSPITDLGGSQFNFGGRPGYKDGNRLSIGGPGVTVVEAADARISIESIPPVLDFDIGGGFGAVLTATLTEFISEDTGGFGGGGSSFGERLWTVSSITITDPGSGYTPLDPNTFFGDFITARVISGFEYPRLRFQAYVSAVDENGGITAVTISPYNTLPPLTVRSGGFANNRITGVTVLKGGRYYAEPGNPSFSPDVSPVTVSVACASGGDGGAIINAIVDSDTSSPTFGQIKELVLVGGGSGYKNDCSNPLP